MSAEADLRVRYLGRRLTVAAILFVPLCDLSIIFSFFPVVRFPGWQWPLIVLAAPVVTWAAWPFYSAAIRGARHLRSTMDTLVSLGIIAATGWSVYTMFWQDTDRGPQSVLSVLTHQAEVASTSTSPPASPPSSSLGATSRPGRDADRERAPLARRRRGQGRRHA